MILEANVGTYLNPKWKGLPLGMLLSSPESVRDLSSKDPLAVHKASLHLLYVLQGTPELQSVLEFRLRSVNSE